jgi:ribosomal protein S18 acetylase RimI-like enzyme
VKDLVIRPAINADLELCLALDHTCSTEYVWQMAVEERDGALGITFRTARLPRSMKVLYPRSGESLQHSWVRHDCFLVAQIGDESPQIVGYLNMWVHAAQEAGWIADLAVDSPYRMKGIGTRLLHAARTWAHERALRRLIVETQTKNYPAIRFLRRRGLTFCGYSDLYYPNQDIAVFFGQSLR